MNESKESDKLAGNLITLQKLDELRNALVDIRSRYAECSNSEEKALLARELRRARLNYDKARFVYYTKLSNKCFRETRRFAYPSN